MRAYPNPLDATIIELPANRPIVLANADGKAVPCSSQSLKIEIGVLRIEAP